MSKTEKTNNQVLLDQYKNAKRAALQKRNGSVAAPVPPTPPPPAPTIPPHHNHLHLIERNNQLEAEVETLKRLLSAQSQQPNKIIQSYLNDSSSVDLLQFDTGPTSTPNKLDPFSATANNLVPREEFTSSLHGRANDLVNDVERMKRDLMYMVAGKEDEGSEYESMNKSVDDFFEPPPTSWESEG
jgi:hypothetical protein